VPPDGNPPGRGPPTGGFPGGGFPGWGPPGGGPPGGGPPGGGPPGGGPPPPALIQMPRTDKLMGNPPHIFTGDRTKSEEFITQWEMYEGVNISNNLMRNAYQRSLLFMTYIQGLLVNEGIKSMNAWLRLQITRNGRPTNDEWLWDSTLLSFNRQYADILGQEKARAELERGFKMEKGDIDAYIAKFEQVIRQAGLDVDQPLVVNKLARGLPREMYDFIYTHKDPQMYEQWRNEAFRVQKRYVHLKNWINDFRTTGPKPQQQWRGITTAHQDPNAMDTSPGRTRARFTGAKEQTKPCTQNNRWKGQGQSGNKREVICHRCQKPGHMIRDCRQPPQQRQWQPRQTTSQGRQTETDEYEQVACVVADNRNPQQKADDWLKNIANKDDETKDAIMQMLWKQEDFPNA
jgi:hypothetical protein